MSIAASGDGFTSSEVEGAVRLPPSGVVATATSDPELMAMLAQAAVSIGLEVNRPPSPEPSRLDDWFLREGRGSQPCLSSRRCMRSWRSRGWPLSRPEATRPPPPSSLPSTAEWPGGTRAFPRWRERSQCTCAHETPPLGGTVHVSRPRPVSWQPLSQPKLIALWTRQPPPCTPWLSCRFTKPRRSNCCTRVVPTRGWCRSCARRLTLLYGWRKSQRGPSGRRCPPWWSGSTISDSTWQRWRTLTRHAFSTPPSPRQGPRVPARPQVVQEVDEAARTRATRRCWNLLFLRRRREQRRSLPWWRAGRRIFCFIFFSVLFRTHFLKERAIFFSSGFSGPWDDSVRRPASSLSPTTHFASTLLATGKRGRTLSAHAPLANPAWDPGSSVRMPQNAPPSVPSTPTPFRCTTTGLSIVLLEPLAQRLEVWLTLPSLSRWLTRTIRLGYEIQFTRRPSKFNGILETSWQSGTPPVLCEEIAVLLAKDAIEPVIPAEMRQGFYSPYFIVPKKCGGLRPILDLRVLNRALHKLPFKMLTHRCMIKCM